MRRLEGGFSRLKWGLSNGNQKHSRMQGSTAGWRVPPTELPLLLPCAGKFKSNVFRGGPASPHQHQRKINDVSKQDRQRGQVLEVPVQEVLYRGGYRRRTAVGGRRKESEQEAEEGWGGQTSSPRHTPGRSTRTHSTTIQTMLVKVLRKCHGALCV